ncbi:MAG TPA: TonB-dependent receptor [Cytophagales bacterium]|nr:TonB-dependent receptor [Cytophagales bacterium]
MSPAIVKVFFTFIFLLSFQAFSQEKRLVQIKGILSDSESGHPLFGATVFIDSLAKGAITKEDGSYEFTIPSGHYKFTYSFIGYESQSLTLKLISSQTKDIKLSPLTTTIEEVVISGEAPDDNVTNAEVGQITIKKKDMENLPYLLGEVDPMRIIQLMPGIQNSGEGNTGFYVRGGAVDQNLVLLDNAVIYNPSHLFGFFSVFNGSVINSVDIYKGGIPSYYGGRLSSITHVNTRKGSLQDHKVEGGVGFVAANLTVEGPIKKNKGSFLISGRRTYVDFFAGALKEMEILKQDINYYFYDVNINLNYSISPKNELSLKTFSGNDNFTYNTNSDFSNSIAWGNKAASLNWKHFFNEDMHQEVSLVSSLYDMDFGAKINTYFFNISSNISDYGLNYQLNGRKKKHNYTVGFNYVYHILKPNNLNASSGDQGMAFNNRSLLFADEGALFINDNVKLSEKIEFNAGLRLSAYSQMGSFTRYIEDENLQILDTVSYKRNKRIKSYMNLEPRFAFRYSLNEKSSLKLSYDKTNQYMHMAPLSSVSLPMDTWVPSSDKVKPQASQQVSGGYFRNFMDNAVESSVMLYYKKMENQIEYRDGVIIGYSKGVNFDDNFVFGEGLSYGMEFMLKKNEGKLTGQIGYTLSKTTRKFGELNAGKSFTAKYDRLHDFSTLVNYILNPKWTLSGIFVYATGNALNLPIARYIVQGNVVNEYGERNSFRMPSYHRLDLSVTFTARKTNKFESYWNFSIYNVYNKKNPYYIYFETKGDIKEYKLETSLKQVSLFPIIPSLAYRFKF